MRYLTVLTFLLIINAAHSYDLVKFASGRRFRGLMVSSGSAPSSTKKASHSSDSKSAENAMSKVSHKSKKGEGHDSGPKGESTSKSMRNGSSKSKSGSTSKSMSKGSSKSKSLKGSQGKGSKSLKGSQGKGSKSLKGSKGKGSSHGLKASGSNSNRSGMSKHEAHSTSIKDTGPDPTDDAEGTSNDGGSSSGGGGGGDDGGGGGGGGDGSTSSCQHIPVTFYRDDIPTYYKEGSVVEGIQVGGLNSYVRTDCRCVSSPVAGTKLCSRFALF